MRQLLPFILTIFFGLLHQGVSQIETSSAVLEMSAKKEDDKKKKYEPFSQKSDFIVVDDIHFKPPNKLPEEIREIKTMINLQENEYLFVNPIEGIVEHRSTQTSVIPDPANKDKEYKFSDDKHLIKKEFNVEKGEAWFSVHEFSEGTRKSKLKKPIVEHSFEDVLAIYFFKGHYYILLRCDK